MDGIENKKRTFAARYNWENLAFRWKIPLEIFVEQLDSSSTECAKKCVQSLSRAEPKRNTHRRDKDTTRFCGK